MFALRLKIQTELSAEKVYPRGDFYPLISDLAEMLVLSLFLSRTVT